jgi:hypothetical protein
VVDAVNSVRFVLARVNGNKDYPAPDPMPRPGMDRAQGIGAASEEALEAMHEALEFLNSLRARRG